MNDNKKYSLIILGLFIVGAIFTVIWGMVLNFGKLTVQAEAPFQIDVIAGPSMECTQSLCELDVKPGKQTIIFRKSGFREEKKEMEIKRWGTNEVKIDFQFIPTIQEVPVTAENEKKQKTEIPAEALASYISPDGPGAIYLINQSDGKQALILEEGEEKQVLSYFPKPFAKPTMFVDDDSRTIAIVESLEQQDQLYLIDIEASSKKNIFQSSAKIKTVAISPDGTKVAVVTTENAFLINQDGTSQELSFDIHDLGVAWYDNETLALLSTSLLNSDIQQSTADASTGEITFQDYLTLLEVTGDPEEGAAAVPETTVIVYLYNIINDSAKRLVAISGTTNLPSSLTVEEENSAKKLFFYENLGKKFQVVFEQ